MNDTEENQCEEIGEELRRYQHFTITDEDTIDLILEDYRMINDVFDYENVLFEFHLRYTRDASGSMRSRNIICSFDKIEALMREEMIEIEKYENDDNLDYNYKYSHIAIRPSCRKSGKGGDRYWTKRLNNNVYTIHFSKSTTKCMTISCIKYKEPRFRDSTATDLDKHYLMHNYKEDKQVKRIKNYYDIDRIITLSCDRSLEMLTDEDFEKNIILWNQGNHIGYVTKEAMSFKKNESRDEEQDDVEEINEDFVNTKVVNRKISYYVCLDLEFGWTKDEEDEENLRSEEPSLVCIKVMTAQNTFEKAYKNVKQVLTRLIAMSKTGLVVVYSHNGGKVEHLWILKSLIRDFKVANKNEIYKLPATNGTQIKMLRYGCNLMFFDSVLLCPMSIKDMSKSFGTIAEKGHSEWVNGVPPPLWYENKKWDWKNEDDIEYCMNDVRIPFEALLKYNESIRDLVSCRKMILPNGEEWVLGNCSVSSIGKQTIFNMHPDLPNTLKEKGLTQSIYFGGRCEMFRKGLIKDLPKDKKMIITDATSMYPTQALKPLPGKVLYSNKKIPEKSTRIWMSDCLIKYKNLYTGQNKPPIGILKDNQFIFPNFVNPTLVTLWDFEYYKHRDNIEIIEVKQTYYFEKISIAPLINKWFERKKNGETKAIIQSAKTLLNGSLGGLGQKFSLPQKVLLKEEHKYAEKLNLTDYTYYEAFDDWKWFGYLDFIESKTSYQTIAYITALSRSALWEKFHEDIMVQDKTAEWLYCDTDSVIAIVSNECAEYLKNNQSKDLGGWDYLEIIAICLRGLKKYGYITINLEKVIKMNGLPKEESNKLELEDLLKPTITGEKSQWFRHPWMGITMKSHKTSHTKEYTKGIVEDNNYVTPLMI